jgi:hypothetical protein
MTYEAEVTGAAPKAASLHKLRCAPDAAGPLVVRSAGSRPAVHPVASPGAMVLTVHWTDTEPIRCAPGRLKVIDTESGGNAGCPANPWRRRWKRSVPTVPNMSGGPPGRTCSRVNRCHPHGAEARARPIACIPAARL